MADTTGGLCFTTKALNCRGIGYQLRFKCFHCHQIPDYGALRFINRAGCPLADDIHEAGYTLTKSLLSALLVIALAALTAWAQTPDNTANPDGVQRISVTDLKAKLDKKEKVIVVDVRAHTGSMIKGALHIPLADLEKQT